MSKDPLASKPSLLRSEGLRRLTLRCCPFRQCLAATMTLPGNQPWNRTQRILPRFCSTRQKLQSPENHCVAGWLPSCVFTCTFWCKCWRWGHWDLVSVSVCLIMQYRWVRNVDWFAMEWLEVECMEVCSDQWGMWGRWIQRFTTRIVRLRSLCWNVFTIRLHGWWRWGKYLGIYRLDVREKGYEDWRWIKLAQDCVQWRALILTI